MHGGGFPKRGRRDDSAFRKSYMGEHTRKKRRIRKGNTITKNKTRETIFLFRKPPNTAQFFKMDGRSSKKKQPAGLLKRSPSNFSASVERKKVESGPSERPNERRA